MAMLLRSFPYVVFLKKNLVFFLQSFFFFMPSPCFYWSNQDQICTIDRPHHAVLQDEAVQDFIFPFRNSLPFIDYFRHAPPFFFLKIP